MFDRIVVATDLSAASTALLRCVERLAALGAHEVVLLHVLSVHDVGGLALRLRELSWPAIEAQQRALEGMGYAVRAELPIGEPHYEITRTAQEAGASLVVLGSHGAGIARTLLLGSVSNEVLQTTTLPVLLVRVGLVEEEGDRHFAAAWGDLPDRLLFPTAFPDTAERAFGYVEHLVKRAHSSVTL
jgi:nucleotide-binding universal stress UspA family protein